MASNSPVKTPITRPQMPPLERYVEIVSELFSTRLLSNFGKYSRLFEERAAAALDHPRPLCVSNCDTGLVLAWRSLGVHGGEVIVPSFTFCSTVNALRWNGLVPVFADIDPHTFCIDINEVRRLITPRTVAIAPVHVYGCPAPIAELEAIAREHGLLLVFDAAHGLGGRYHGRGLGAFGDASIFSLSGTKLITSAEGGLACFRDPAAADRFSYLRAYGFRGDYNCLELGLNGKLSEFHAALGWLALELLEGALRQRTRQVERYKQAFENRTELTLQAVPHGCAHGYKDFAVLFQMPEYRATAESALAAAGVQTKRYFFPAHRMIVHRAFATRPLPVTDDVYSRVLCLPVYHDLSAMTQDWIIDVVLSAARGQAVIARGA
jgi:dTDP-4-amino-4,6-dideoxygalactose transaminase